MKVPIKIPTIEEMRLNKMNVFEHTPIAYFLYGEYPRDINPIGGHLPKTKVIWIEEKK